MTDKNNYIFELSDQVKEGQCIAVLSCKKSRSTEMTPESCKGRLFTNRELWRLMCPLVVELLKGDV